MSSSRSAVMTASLARFPRHLTSSLNPLITRSVMATKLKDGVTGDRQVCSRMSIARAMKAITPSSISVTFDIGRSNTVPKHAH